MQLQIHTDNHVERTDELTQQVHAVVEGTLDRFGEQLMRVEVHINDTNSSEKNGANDKRCMMEARLAGMQPIAVTHHAASLEQAIDGAAEKLERTLDHRLGKLEHKKGNTSFGGDQTI